MTEQERLSDMLKRYQYQLDKKLFNNPYYKTKEEEKIDVELKKKELEDKLKIKT